MGLWGAIKSAGSAIADGAKSIANKAVEAVSTYVAKGVGKIIQDSLQRLGIPGPLATLVAMALDPRFAKEEIMEGIEVVGKELGVPDSVLKKLKGIVNSIDDYVKAFATGGPGGLVKELGKDLGLPPALYNAISIAVDIGTGNYAGAAMTAVQLAAEAAKELGIPADAVDVVALGASIAKGDTEGMKKYGAEVASDLIEHMPGVPPEMKDALQAGAQYAGGNTEKAKAEAAQLVSKIADQLPLPEEIKTLGKMGAAYVGGDKEGLKQASMELAKELAGRLDLPPAAQNVFDAGLALVAGDTKTAAAKLGIPEEVLNKGIEVAKNRDKYIAELKKVASDPAAQKAFAEKMMDTAIEKAPGFIAQQLGVDPKYVDMAKTAYNVGSDIYQNREAYMALAKDIATDPKVRKEFAQAVVGDTLSRLGVSADDQKLAQQFLKDPIGTLDANKEKLARAALNKAGISDQQIDAAKKFLDNPEAAIKAGGDALVRDAKAALAKLGITEKVTATIEAFVKDPGGAAKKATENYLIQLGKEFGIPANVCGDLLDGNTKSAEKLAKDTARDTLNANLPQYIRV